MTNHYYSESPHVPSQRRHIRAVLRGIELSLTTDTGVFSKQGVDFGTRLLIETVELSPGMKVADLGCGYGAVSSVLARVYPDTQWWLIDVNERAVELARENTADSAPRIQALVSDGFESVRDLQVNAVILNPPIRAGKSVVYRLFQESAEHLVPGGALWVVMHKKHGALSAQNKLSELFSKVELARRDAGYHVFLCVR